jgi:streptogramin lyase
MSKGIVIAAIVSAVWCSAAAEAADLIYSTARAGLDLVRIEPSSGDMTVVGRIGYEGSTALASAPDGTLYTVTDSSSSTGSTSQLAKVEPATGKATLIGQPWGKPVGVTALAVTPDGTIYAGGLFENKLYRIDPATGGLAEIAPFQGGKDIHDFAVHPESGAMYAVGRGTLYTLDTGTGALTEVAPITNASPDIQAIEFGSDGVLYGANSGKKTWFYRIDPKTGVGEKIGDLPEPHLHSAARRTEP